MLVCSCATIKDSSILNGTWIPTHQEINGSTLPKAVFEKQRLVISDTTYTLQAESIDKGTMVIGEKTMDIYSKEGVNTGKHFTALYKIENGELTICYNLAGTSYPVSFETKGNPKLFLSAFRKIE